MFFENGLCLFLPEGPLCDRDRATARKPLTLVDHFDIKHQVSDAFYGCERCEGHFSNFCLDEITLLFKNSCKNLLLKGKAGRENWRRRECHQSEPRRPGDGVSGRTPRRRARANAWRRQRASLLLASPAASAAASRQQLSFKSRGRRSRLAVV